MLFRHRLQTTVPEHPDMMTRLWDKEDGVRFLKYMYRRSESLRAGRSGDRILVEATFFAPVQTGLGAHQASCTVGT